jgi:hypothetical protein
MRKYAAATALVIVLNITMLAPAFSTGPPHWMPRDEVDCDSSARGLPGYAIRCHCSFECRRQYPPYTVSLPCNVGGITGHLVPWRQLPPGRPGRHEGFCDTLVSPIGTLQACFATCVKAKKGTYP